MIGAFFKGFAEGVTEDFAYIRERVEAQAAEARKMRKVLAERREKAQGLRQQIKQASASTGVRQEVFYDAFKNGQFEEYYDLVTDARKKAAATGQSLSPETLESWYAVPAEMSSLEEMNVEIPKIFGLMRESVNENDEMSDYTASQILFSAIGGNVHRQVESGLRNYDIGQESAWDLLNLPSGEMPESTGGRVADKAYQDAFGIDKTYRAAGRIGGGGGSEFDPNSSDVRLWSNQLASGAGEGLATHLNSVYNLGLPTDFFTKGDFPMVDSVLFDAVRPQVTESLRTNAPMPAIDPELYDRIAAYDPENRRIIITRADGQTVPISLTGQSYPEPTSTPTTLTGPPSAEQ